MPLSTTLADSPAKIVAQLLIDLGLASAPPTPPAAPSAWPAHTDGEPGLPDGVITVKDTTGKDDGRSMIDGHLFTQYGVQVRVRAKDHPTGWAKANAIRDGLSSITQRAVTVGSTTYVVVCLARIGQVLILGKEVGVSSKRHLFTLNALVTLRQL